MRWKRVDCLGKPYGGDSGSGRRRRRKGGGNKMETKKEVKQNSVQTGAGRGFQHSFFKLVTLVY